LDRRAKEQGVELLLPEDVVVTDKVAPDGRAETVDAAAVPADRAIVDIGPMARSSYARAVEGAGTILWNGPMGVFEIPAFAEGTKAIAQALASSGAVTV